MLKGETKRRGKKSACEGGLERRKQRYRKECVIVAYTAANPEEFAGRFATPEEYASYEVLDPRYKRIGSVKELLVNAGKELECITVRVGLLGLKSVLISVQSV